MLWIQEKTSSSEQLWDAESFLRVFPQEGRRGMFLGAVFLSQEEERFWQQRDYCQVHLDSRQVSALTNWTGSPSTVKVHNVQCRAISPLHWRAEGNYRALFPLLPCNWLQQAAVSPELCRDTSPAVSSLPAAPAPRRPLALAVGTQIPTAGGLAHVRSSHCVMSATQSANASGWILAWTLQREAKIRACNMEICNILCTWVAQCIPTQTL